MRIDTVLSVELIEFYLRQFVHEASECAPFRITWSILCPAALHNLPKLFMPLFDSEIALRCV